MKKYRVTVNGVSYEVDVELLHDEDANPPPANRLQFQELVRSAPATLPPAAAPERPAPGDKVDRRTVVSPMAGTVRKINVKPGDIVRDNEVLVVLEAMKMNSNIVSPSAGKVRGIAVEVGATVQQGQILVTFE